ncbi:membrane-bounded cytochrome biogenesis cycZ-like domain [Piscinibacter sakaiensis]|uniref:Membrane-bounded cytochrome biogenesis cycZ-like domain n=2 Tax=Piscinibacter sakaiensis TaxID=1547922 RepID=A0A0K8NTY1_PISS1|nr:membrane-bounded cytochrome biogenesis cycZ-like domain [Piscinibacter sakaiensis]
MCGAACATVVGLRPGGADPGTARSLAAWHAGRLVSYAAAGAVAASSVALLAQWGRELAWLRPWWLMLHVAALVLGLWLLWAGRMPVWLSQAPRLLPWQRGGRAGGRRVVWLRAGGAGLAWAAWPCGLLHAALFSAALGSTATEGALVMAAFAAGSGVGLWLGPALWLRWAPQAAAPGAAGGVAARLVRVGPAQAVRLAGALLAVGSAWAVGHDLFVPWIDALCA